MTKLGWTATCLVLCCAPCVRAASGGDAPPALTSAVLLEIDGTKITVGDFEKRRPTALFQARTAYFDAQKKAVDEFINDYVLERQAEKEHSTVADLLKRHVESTLEKDPSEEALRVYYEGLESKEPYETMRGKILDHIREIRMEKAKSEYVRSLRSQSTIAVFLGPPRAPVSLKDTPVRGDTNAPVVLIEFADYECPYCQQVEPTLSKLAEQYKGKLLIAYKDTPLPMHPHAPQAAEAAHCAGAQGKYWEYHDLLLANKQLEIAELKQDARTLKLDGAAFDKCLDEGAMRSIVKAHVAEAVAVGVQGTPSFLINGRFLTGNVSYDTLRGIVDEELAAAKQKQQQIARR